jgi:CTP synthase (UTP-ammonia lyase)
MEISDADTAENGFADHTNIIVPVSCPVPNREQNAPKLSGGVVVNILPESRLAKILGRTQLAEQFFCNYEVDPGYCRRIESENTGMRIVARGESGELRGVEINAHPFYVATLFQPQLTSVATGEPHPMIAAYLQSCVSYSVGIRT